MKQRKGWDSGCEVSFDIELTNACNASCTFCPRENMPELGVITDEHFYKSVDRAVEYSSQPNFKFCGTGDALLNRNVVAYARYILARGYELTITTNGYLMDEQRALGLIEAGLSKIVFSVSSTGEQYRKEYGLDFDVTRRNILRFVELARGKCQVIVSIVTHEQHTDYIEMESYWRSQGVNGVVLFDMNNRAGALFSPPPLRTEEVAEVKRALAELGEATSCLVPFFYLFVGWDGHYYLCSSDWKKQAALGHVMTHSVQQTVQAREEAVKTRAPICRVCTVEPVNSFVARSDEALRWVSI